MTILVQATPAPKPRTDTVKQMSLLYAAVLVVFVVAQLFTFDEFTNLIISFNLPLSDAWTFALAPTLIAAELFALPFLLRMKLSIAFRWLSMFLGWLVPALWLFISFVAVTTQPNAETIGFLGTVVDVVPGWWAVLASFALGVLAAWSGWGLWPGKRAVAKK